MLCMPLVVMRSLCMVIVMAMISVLSSVSIRLTMGNMPGLRSMIVMMLTAHLDDS